MTVPRLFPMLAASVLLAAGAAPGDDPAGGRPAPKAEALPRAGEQAVLAFVGEHQPELGTLLDSLRPMRPAEYQKAVRQLLPVVQSLQALRTQNPERYGLGLAAWKARTRVELLSARLASHAAPGPDLERDLRRAVVDQVETEIRVQRYDRDQAEARVRRLTETLQRLETDPSGVAEARFQALLKKTRPMNAARAAAKAKKAAPKAAPKPSPNANPNPTATSKATKPSQGERP